MFQRNEYYGLCFIILLFGFIVCWQLGVGLIEQRLGINQSIGVWISRSEAMTGMQEWYIVVHIKEILEKKTLFLISNVLSTP
jgi:hypothetical protein